MTLHFLCPRYTIVLVKIDNKKEGVLPSSSFVDFIETLRDIFTAWIWMFIRIE